MRKVEKEKDDNGKLIIPEILNNPTINSEWEEYAKGKKLPGSIRTHKKRKIEQKQ